MKKLPLLLTLVTLTACGGTTPKDTSSISVLTPSGAPTLAFYNKLNQFTTASAAPEVKSQFLKAEYDALVFDFKTGLDDIKRISEEEGKTNYKLARILTAGNLVLVGINKTVEPSAGDRIVSFGEGLLPDLAFKELYGNSGATIDYVPGLVNNVAPVLKTGVYNSEPVDYVVIAEPVLTSTLSQVEDPSIYTQFSIRNKWEEVKGAGHLIPQGGLFFKVSSYETDEAKYKQFLEELDKDITSALDDPTLLKTACESVGDVEAQKAKFGVPAAMAFKVTKANNGCGLVSEYNKLVLTNFFQDINQSVDTYKDYIL